MMSHQKNQHEDPKASPQNSGASGTSSPGQHGNKKAPSWRSVHRSRSHDSAHLDDESAHPHRAHTIEHPLIPLGQATLILDQSSLDDLIDELRAAKSFAYDTEFIGEL